MSSHEVNGSCLCGKVKINASTENKTFDACHCSICRKWGGGPVMTVHVKPDMKISGEDSVTAYSSSEWAERGFCKNCGSHLFYRLKDGSAAFLLVGILENTADFKFNMQIFIDKKPANYSFAEPTEKLTEAEFFAKFGG